MYSKFESEPNTRSPPLSGQFKFKKGMAFSVLDSLITVPLQSTSAINNLGYI